MSSRDDSRKVLQRLDTVKIETAELPRVKCPHCDFKWTPKRKRTTGQRKSSLWCPRCHRNTKETVREKLTITRRPLNDKELQQDRFKPAFMKDLCERRLYRFRKVNRRELPPLTDRREQMREANIQLMERYFDSELNISDLADALGVSRQAAFIRINRGFEIAVQRGSFWITPKGRETFAGARLRRASGTSPREGQPPSRR